MAAHGIYRIRDGWVNEHSAVVKFDDGNEVEIPESRYRGRWPDGPMLYRTQGYMPAFDELPWKDEDDSK